LDATVRHAQGSRICRRRLPTRSVAERVVCPHPKVVGLDTCMLATVYLDGKKLRRIRTLKGKTQRALSSESGVSTSTIWLLERREKNENFHPPTLTKLARALGVEPTDLVSGE
jgi:DNA-binding Xre family transcriptional regulator